MKQFLETNTITYNLMSFTAFKSILIFSLLLEGPVSYKDIQDFFENHEYLHETVSVDTLRIYLNSLREIGCVIKKQNIGGVTKYALQSHPFVLKFTDKQVKSIIKVYKAISKNIEVTDLMSLQQFFCKIAQYVDNETLKQKLQTISPLNGINLKIIEDLITYTHNNNEITVEYNSSASGMKSITILADKLYINNGKLYLSGYNSAYKSYSSFLVSKISRIVSISYMPKIVHVPEITVGYKYCKDGNEELELLDSEKLISSTADVQIIEISSKNKFEIMQRIMSHSSKCTVLYPEDFRAYVISNLKKMKEGYIERY